MGSPLYDTYNQAPTIQNGSQMNAIARVQQLLQMTRQTPEQLVKSMLQSGQITQDQFNQAAQMANMITGKK